MSDRPGQGLKRCAQIRYDLAQEQRRRVEAERNAENLRRMRALGEGRS